MHLHTYIILIYMYVYICVNMFMISGIFLVIFSFQSIQPRVETRPVMARRRETPGSGTERRRRGE